MTKVEQAAISWCVARQMFAETTECFAADRKAREVDPSVAAGLTKAECNLRDAVNEAFPTKFVDCIFETSGAMPPYTAFISGS